MEEAFNIYFVGTAGSGKSTLTAAFSEWLQSQGYDSIIVNLDPGAETLLYEPDVDIRDWINLREIMKEYNLGPNGAQIVAADLLAVNTSKISDIISGFDTDFVLFDTPGQLELFAFRNSGKKIMEAFDPEQSMICFLIDPMLARDPNGFVTSMVISTITNFRLEVPIFNAISKADLLTEEEMDRITEWSDSNEVLFNALMDEARGAQNQVSMEVLRALETVGAGGGAVFVSAETMSGIEDIYTVAQEIASGGTDREPR